MWTFNIFWSEKKIEERWQHEDLLLLFQFEDWDISGTHLKTLFVVTVAMAY
jgi:hypothetical protein